MATRTRVNDQGLIEILDENGYVIERQKPSINKPHTTKTVRPTKANKSRPTSRLGYGAYPYKQQDANYICELVAQGKTIEEVGGHMGLPPSWVIRNWQRKYKQFREEMKLAREMRGDYFHDKVVETADKSKKATIYQDKLKVEAYKWAAEKNNPQQYAAKQVHSGDTDNPIQFIIDTGVPVKPKEIEVENKEANNRDQLPGGVHEDLPEDPPAGSDQGDAAVPSGGGADEQQEDQEVHEEGEVVLGSQRTEEGE